jgi:hypothetical protein
MRRGMRGMRGRDALLGLVAPCCLWLVGCAGGTETGNPVVTGSLSYTGVTSSPQRFGVGQGGEVATIEAAWFNLDVVTVSATGCGAPAHADLEIAALGLGDHAAGNHNSTAFQVEPGSFCRVELPFVSVPDDASSGPERLRGHAILLEGRLADGTPFSILSNAVPKLPLQSEPGGFRLATGSADALVAFDFAGWLGRLDFAAATLTGGVLEISAESNRELLAQFEEDLGAGVVLYRDADADGRLDDEPDELARVR